MATNNFVVLGKAPLGIDSKVKDYVLQVSAVLMAADILLRVSARVHLSSFLNSVAKNHGIQLAATLAN